VCDEESAVPIVEQKADPSVAAATEGCLLAAWDTGYLAAAIWT
jgi:hypothetical protein